MRGPGERQAADPTGLYALFTEGDVFVTELTEDKGLVERRVVRRGKAARPSEDGASAGHPLQRRANRPRCLALARPLETHKPRVVCRPLSSYLDAAVNAISAMPQRASPLAVRAATPLRAKHERA